MSESFENVVKYAKAVTADCDMPIIDRLKEAHERELSEVQAHYELSHCPSCEARLSVQDRQYQIEQMAEYHRGYTDGLHARDTATWQLDQERREVVNRLREYDVDNDTYDAFAKALGVGQDECIRTRIIHLLGYEQSDMVNCGNPYKEGGAVLDAGVITSMEHDEARSNEAEPTCQKPRKPSISDKESGPKLSKSADMTNNSITEELRKFKGHINVVIAPEMVLALRAEVNGIADRIGTELTKLAYERSHFEHERDQLATKVENQRKRLSQLEKIVNTWNYEDGTYWSPMAADKTVRKANEKAERLHVMNYEQTLRISALSEECDMYREMLNDATVEYKYVLLELLNDAASESKGLMEERKGSVDEQRQ